MLEKFRYSYFSLSVLDEMVAEVLQYFTKANAGTKQSQSNSRDDENNDEQNKLRFGLLRPILQ